jgi:hypothetical protein
MRVDEQVAERARLGLSRGKRRSLWRALRRARRQRVRNERLEVIERLDAERRNVRRAGSYAPNLTDLRRWS